MKYTKQEIVTAMKQTGIVSLLSHEDPELAHQILAASYKGGVRVFEFTNRKKNSFEVFSHLISVVDQYPGLMLGIGTIMDETTTEKFIKAGAHFIISPILKISMASVCHQHRVHWIPGCATLTEIVTAKEAGAEVIKIFPGSVLGPGFVSSILPVVSDLQLMITGGVETNEKNLSSWFNAGAMCVGLGSQLFTKELLESKNWNELTVQVEKALALVKQIKK